MITYESWTEYTGEEWCEYTCTCDKCHHEVEPEDLFEVERYDVCIDGRYLEEGTYCRECLLKMIPHTTDDEGYEELDLGTGKTCPVDDLEGEFCTVDPWEVEKWNARYGYEPDWDLMAKDKLLWD